MSELTKAIDDLKTAISWNGRYAGIIDLNLLVARLEKIDKQPELDDNQQMILDWMLDETADVQEYSFHPTGIINELTSKSKLVPRPLKELWIRMEEQKRQQVIMRFLAIKNGYASTEIGNQKEGVQK